MNGFILPVIVRLQNNLLLRLFILALILYSLLFFLFPITFYADSEQYLKTAKAILGQNNGEYYYYRTIGYPLFMNLFGVITLKTFTPLLIFQLISSALIPPLIYATLNNVYPRAALAAALITLISFTPTFFAKVIMTDQISMLLRFLLVYLASLCIFSKFRLYHYTLLLICGYALYLMRPSDSLTFLVVPTSMLLFRIGKPRALLISIFCFVLAIIATSHLRDFIALKYSKQHGIISTSVTGTMTGKMLFFNVYAVGPKFTRSPTIYPGNGPYSTMLTKSLIDWGNKNPMGVNSYSIQGAAAYPNIYKDIKNPEQFANALVAEQGLFGHSVMWLALDQQLGAYDADRLFLYTAIEAYLANPKALLLLYDGIIEFFFEGDVIYNAGTREVWNIRPSLGAYIASDTALSGNLKDQLIKDTGTTSSLLIHICETLFLWITAIKIISVILAIAFLPCSFIINRKISCYTFTLISILLYHALITVAFAAPHFRYVWPQVPLIIMISSLGAASFKQLYKQKTAVAVRI
jgi:hypothetical protein